MRASRSVLLIAALGLAGCDRLTGADQQKILDAEATGYACRVSLKSPEDCMKENEIYSPTSILTGWKAADRDIEGQMIDPSMGKNKQIPPPQMPAAAPPQSASAVVASENKNADGKPVPAKPAAAQPPSKAAGQ